MTILEYQEFLEESIAIILNEIKQIFENLNAKNSIMNQAIKNITKKIQNNEKNKEVFSEMTKQINSILQMKSSPSLEGVSTSCFNENNRFWSQIFCSRIEEMMKVKQIFEEKFQKLEIFSLDISGDDLTLEKPEKIPELDINSISEIIEQPKIARKQSISVINHEKSDSNSSNGSSGYYDVSSPRPSKSLLKRDSVCSESAEIPHQQTSSIALGDSKNDKLKQIQEKKRLLAKDLSEIRIIQSLKNISPSQLTMTISQFLTLNNFVEQKIGKKDWKLV